MVPFAFALPVDLEVLISNEKVQIFIVALVLFVGFAWLSKKVIPTIWAGLHGRLPAGMFERQAKQQNSDKTVESFLSEMRLQIQDRFKRCAQDKYPSLRELMLALGTQNNLEHTGNYPEWTQRWEIFDKKKVGSIGRPLLETFSRKIFIEGKLFTYLATRVHDQTFELLWSTNSSVVHPVEIMVNSKKIGFIDVVKNTLSGTDLDLDYKIEGVFKGAWVWPHLEVLENGESIAKIVLKHAPKAVWTNRFKFFSGRDHGLALFVELPPEEVKNLLVFALGIFYSSSRAV